jgi:undecaprenyl pyrophosphate phosphatase UppP
MKKPLITAAALDYYKTRKKLWLKFLIAFIPALVVGIILNYVAFKQALDINGVSIPVNIGEVFKDFVNVQISAVAILISFFIAIITILVSADNPNIKKLKEKHSTECKKLSNKQPLNLFQVLLSNITYNVLIEVVYLGFLILCIFLQLYFDDEVHKWLMAICVFFIVHILHILLESVGQMYLTFWKHEE